MELNIQPDACILTEYKKNTYIGFRVICTHTKLKMNQDQSNSHIEDTYARIYLYVLVSL